MPSGCIDIIIIKISVSVKIRILYGSACNMFYLFYTVYNSLLHFICQSIPITKALFITLCVLFSFKLTADITNCLQSLHYQALLICCFHNSEDIKDFKRIMYVPSLIQHKHSYRVVRI